MTTTRLSLVRGDTAVYDFTVLIDGVAADLTGASIFFTVKAKITDPDASKKFQKTLGSGITCASPATGVFRLTISPSDTSGLNPNIIYVWDVQIKLSSGSIVTPDGLMGDLALVADVYNAVT